MNKMVNRCIYLINVKFSQKIVFKLFRQHNKFVVFLWKGLTVKSLCTLFLFLKWLLICSLVHLHMSLYCCHIHAYTIFYFSFFLILYFLLNLMVQYFLLIPINSYFYIIPVLYYIEYTYPYYKREFDYAKNEALSVKTNTSCAN